MQASFMPIRILIFLVALLLAGTSTTAVAQTYQYDNAGRLTAAHYTSGASIRYAYDAAGNVIRIQHIPAPPLALPPDGVIDTPTGDVTISTGGSVDFTGSAADPDGAVPLAYRWDFDGGAPESTDEDPGPTVFNTAGTYVVRFHVTDATNLSDPTPDTVTVTVSAESPPPPPNNGGSNKKSGGGAMGWLILPLLGAWLLRHRRRLAPLCALLLSGLATAQTATWQQMTSPTTENLNAVWGFSATEVYAVGNKGTVLFFDGSAWSEFSTPFIPAAVNLTAIWGRTPDDLYVGGTSSDPTQTEFLWHFNGGDWAAIVLPEFIGLTDIWSPAPTAPLYLVSGVKGWQLDAGLDPRVPENWLQRGWVELFSGSTTASAVITAIGGSARDVLMTGRRGGSATQPGAYRNFGRLTFFNDNMYDVYAFSDTQMVIVGDISYLLNGNVRTYGDWSRITTMSYPYGVWGAAADDFFIVGAENASDGLIQHFDGTITSVALRVPLTIFRDVHGFSAERVFAVGDRGAIYNLAPAEEMDTAANFPFAGTAEGNVNLHTGELVYETTDFSIGSDPLEFRRYYASNLYDQRTVGGSLGENWTHNYEWRLDTDFGPNGNQVRVTDYRGTEYVFEVGATSTTLVSPTWANVTLTHLGQTYVLSDFDTGLMYAVGPTGLSWIQDRNGNIHALTYNQGLLASVSNNKENFLAFNYDATGRLTRVYVPEGGEELEVAFTYVDGFLATATPSGDAATNYSYASGAALLTSVDIGGAVEKVWDYGSQDRVIATTYTDGGPFIYTYNGSQVTVSEPGATTRTYNHNADGALVSLTNGVGSNESWGYDSEGRQVSYKDPAGRTTTWSYDSVHRQVASITEPGGFSTTFEYELGSSTFGLPFWTLIGITHPDTSTESFGIDPNGNIVAYIDQERAQWNFSYDDKGNLLESANPAGGRTVYTHTVDGSILTVKDPAGNLTEFRYDLFQRPTKIYHPDATETTLEYSTRFVPDRVTLKSGAVVDHTWGGGDRLLRTDYSDGSYEIYGYDSAGAIISFELPGGRVTEYRYDARRNIDRVLAPGLTFELFGYDAADRLTTYTDANSQVWRLEYYPDNSTKAVVDPGGARVDYDYTDDPRGLLSTVTKGGQAMRMVYDNLSRLDNLTDPEERVFKAQRDARGWLTSTTILPANITRRFDRSPLGKIEKYTDPNGKEWLRRFGGDGRLAAKADPLGAETTITRDPLNRIEEIRYPDGSTTTMNYAASGLVGNVSGSDGTSVDIDTTPEGRLVSGTELVLDYSTIDGRLLNSNGIGIQYNDQDRPWKITVAPGRVIEYVYDNRGNVTKVRDWLGGETTITPTDAGKYDDIAYPNGIYTDYRYDDRRRLTGIDFGTLGSITLSLSPTTGRLDSAERNLPGPQDIKALDRQFDFDDASRVRGFRYDGRGNLVDDGANLYAYDALNRLVSVSSIGESVLVSYDALGNIVARSDDSGSKRYLNNYALRKPRVTVEQDASGQDLWYYVHTFDGRLLYRMNGDGIRQFYHFDEAGNTVFMTDNAGNVIQTYFYGPMNELLDSSGPEKNDAQAGGETGEWNIIEDISIADQAIARNTEMVQKLQADEVLAGAKVLDPVSTERVVEQLPKPRAAVPTSLEIWQQTAKEVTSDLGINIGGMVVTELEKVLAPQVSVRLMEWVGMSADDLAAALGPWAKSLGSSVVAPVASSVGGALAAARERQSGMYQTDAGRRAGALGVGITNTLAVGLGPTQPILGIVDALSLVFTGDKLGGNDVMLNAFPRMWATILDAFVARANGASAKKSIWLRVVYTKQNEGHLPRMLVRGMEIQATVTERSAFVFTELVKEGYNYLFGE